MKYYKDSVIVMPKQKKVVVKRQFFKKTKSGKFKRIKRDWNFTKEWILKNDIPTEQYTATQSFFDNTAFNNDDREYVSEVIKIRYSIDKINEIKEYVIDKYNIIDQIIQF